MISTLRFGKGVGGTCVGPYRFDTDGEGEVGLSTTVPLPVWEAGRRKGKGCRWSTHAHLGQELHLFANKKQGSFVNTK